MFRARDFLALLVLRRKATQVLRIEVECDRDVRQEVAERDSELRARRTDDIGSNGPADIELVETYGSERFREGIISLEAQRDLSCHIAELHGEPHSTGTGTRVRSAIPLIFPTGRIGYVL